MRRCARYILRGLTILSLLFCLATIILWVRSYDVSDELRWQNHNGWRSIRSAKGSIAIGLLLIDWSHLPPDQLRPLRYQRDVSWPPYNWLLEMNFNGDDTLAEWKRAGFEWHERRNKRRGTLHAHAVVPFWAVVALTAAMPFGWSVIRLRQLRARRRRNDTGLCSSCGYDLRATPEKGGALLPICPECGHASNRYA